MSSRIAVALPGTGSDATFTRLAFGPALSAAGIELRTPEPDPRGVAAGYRAALDEAAREGALLVAGVSIGAVVGLSWAHENRIPGTAVIAVLPPWTGSPADAPAALSARYTAAALCADGLEAVTEQMRNSSPAWLAGHLTRSWRAQWPDLPAALAEAAGLSALAETELAEVEIPVGIVAARDDPVHPLAVARNWARLLPHCGLEEVELDDIGRDPAVLGYAGLTALPT